MCKVYQSYPVASMSLCIEFLGFQLIKASYTYHTRDDDFEVTNVSLLSANSLWHGDAISQHRSGSTLAHVMTCCLTAPSHYLNQWSFLINEVLWYLFTWRQFHWEYWIYLLFIWVRSRNCGCLVTWFCYQLIAKPGNKTAAVLWPDPYEFENSRVSWQKGPTRHAFAWQIGPFWQDTLELLIEIAAALRLQPHLPGANELKIQLVLLTCELNRFIVCIVCVLTWCISPEQLSFFCKTQWFIYLFFYPAAQELASAELHLTHLPLNKMAAILQTIYFRCTFVNETFFILTKISLKFVPKGPIDNNPALVQIMAWCRIGNKPLCEPMLIWFTDAYICDTRGVGGGERWVNPSNAEAGIFRDY